MKRIRGVASCAILLAGAALAQRAGGLPPAEAARLLERSVQLMESNSPAVPGLGRAAEPVLDAARQSLVAVKVTPGHAGHVYSLLASVRSYLALADALPRSEPLPEAGAAQLAELRANTERLERYLRGLLDAKETQLRSPDRDNLRRYRQANESVGPPTPGKPRVVFLGDSITDGWRLQEYFPERDFVNRGISGQITGEMLGRMQADVVAQQPVAMIVLAGTNDIARGVPLTTIENNLTMIADLADFHHIKPLFASVLPVSDYHKDVNPRFEMTKGRPPAQINELNRWLREFCASRKFTYVDYAAALADPQGFLGADYADDGLHPNAEGYQVMAPMALAAIESVTAAPAVPVGKRRR